jgi:hypothetical protein
LAEIRLATLREIEEILDTSYFTKHSFQIDSRPDKHPFLVVTFLPELKYTYALSCFDQNSFLTKESPGEHLLNAEDFTYNSFHEVKQSLRKWTERIKQDLDAGSAPTDDFDQFLDRLRSGVFADASDAPGKFTDKEISDLREKLDALQASVESQAERINATEEELARFQSELAAIKEDLATMPRAIWKQVASNKLLRSVKDFLGTPEGRKLVADGIKKLFGIE